MPSDNVTPFRRPPKRPVAPQQSGGMGFKTHRGKAVLVHALTWACFAVQFFLTGLPLGYFIGLAFGIAAGVIAYSNRPDAMPWAGTHHEFALRTLLFAFLSLTVLALPSYVLSRDTDPGILSVYGQVYFWGRIVIFIWAGLRALIGLGLASARKPVPNPRGWFF
jgi:uncharacterized membrane protein